MPEMRTLVTLVVAIAILGATAVPAAGAAGPVERGSNAVTASVEMAAPSSGSDGNETVTAGQSISTTVGTHESRLSGSFRTVVIETTLASAETPRERALVLAGVEQGLDTELARIKQEQTAAAMARANGTMSPAAYRYRTSILATQAQALSNIATLADREVKTLPDNATMAVGLDDKVFERHELAGNRLHKSIVDDADHNNTALALDGRPLIADRENGFETDFDPTELDNNTTVTPPENRTASSGNGTGWNNTDENDSDWNSTDENETDLNDTDWNGTDWNETDLNDTDWNSIDGNETDPNDTDWNSTDSDTDWSELDWPDTGPFGVATNLPGSEPNVMKLAEID